MRTLVLYISLLFFLLTGKQGLYAKTSQHDQLYTASQTFSKNHQVKFERKEQFNSIIENADFDLEEDQLTGDDLKADNHYNQSVQKTLEFCNWFEAYYHYCISNPDSQRYKNLPTACVSATPIYIAQRVLRI